MPFTALPFHWNSKKLVTGEITVVLTNYSSTWYTTFPVSIYMFKVNNKNTRTRCEICLKLTIKTPQRRHWRDYGVFIVNFEHISHLVLVFLLKLWAGKCRQSLMHLMRRLLLLLVGTQKSNPGPTYVVDKVILGTFHHGDQRFGETAGVQCACNSL